MTTPVNPLSSALRRTLRIAVAKATPPAESGVHPDPAVAHASPPEPTAKARVLRTSPEMAMYRRALQIDDKDVRASVLDDLATHHGITPEQARQRALHWEEDSLAEWATAQGSDSDEGRVAFYRTQHSWGFDLLWWSYLQAEGYGDPASVMAYRWLQQYAPGRRHLDFGSGVGVTSQLFLSGGWSSTLADLSSTLLDLARFRLQRRDQQAAYIDLAESGLPAGAYDAITAIDTLAHVPDVYSTAVALHAALGKGGYLIANFDIRAESPETAWHLYTDDLTAEYELRRAGFRPVADLGYGLVAYKKVGLGRAGSLARGTWDWLTLVSPPRRAARRILRPVLRVLGKARGR